MKRFLTFALMLGLLCTASFFPASASSDAVSDEVITQVIGALGIMTGDENGNLNLYPCRICTYARRGLVL